ncbi:bestrophin family protein [Erwinia piriflorinigrans]|uniref:Bestrophin-1 Vitelliform macular dystrophy protein 2 n=1 Tax=Erwinia piriflorinigrans CFBP 5888 TaxID=1161919 RepID=V5Z7F4_9GAMM|nr:bestrophin family ion channel [Erwinia piriflorinigrans]CCG87262.1 Bestrophin-1 Vitelliform macular dystrophy protein 2 [Erwinia piriflorinigrans CFBP 5888]
MIVRPLQHWFPRLFSWHGAVLSKIMFRLSLNLMMSIFAVICFQWYETLGIRLTTAPFSLLGVAIAIFLGFRNSASYARFVEARTLWGSLLIAQRSLLRQAKGALRNDPLEVSRFCTLLMAFSWSLKHQLRATDDSEDIQRLVPEPYRAQVLASPFRANRLLLCLGCWLADRREEGAISDLLYNAMDSNLNEMAHILGGCERISSTPIPFAYSLILHRTVYLFCTLLPFALVADLHAMTPLVSVFISYTFLSLESLAEELEEPFGIAANDLPLNALCTATERLLKEMDDRLPLPAMPKPDARFNLV